MLQFPDCWPLDKLAPSKAPGVTREWAMRLLVDHAWGDVAFPERTRAALQRYCHPDQPAPPAPPASTPTRPKPSQATTQAKQGGGNRPLSNSTMPSFTKSTAAWFETARRTLRFKGGVSGGVHLDATLPNLRTLLDAGPKTDLSSLRGIAISRRKQLDPDKVERHFEAGGQGAEAAYYAKVLRELYGEIVGLRDVRIDGKPTGEIKPKQINALGFPAGSTPQETRNAVLLWGRFHMGTWSQRESAKAALRSAMAAYAGDTAEPNQESRNLRTEQGSQPSVRLSPTHERDSAERTRRLEMRERLQACVIYSRGEIPPWVRNYSPLGDLPFLRSMTGLEQAAVANEFPSPGLVAFIAASTEEEIQERERAEVRKHTSNDRTPPWYVSDGHKATSNFAVRESARSAQPSGELAPTHADAGSESSSRAPCRPVCIGSVHTGGLRASGIPRRCPGRGVHRPRTRQGDDSRAEIYEPGPDEVTVRSRCGNKPTCRCEQA